MERIAGIEEAGKARVKADNILCFFYDKCNPVIPAPKNMTLASPMDRNDRNEDVILPDEVKVRPNPADEYVTFEFKVLKANPQTTLQVFSSEGKRVESFTLGKTYQGQQLMDIRDLSPGVYFVELVQKGEKLDNAKFIIQH